VQHNII